MSQILIPEDESRIASSVVTCLTIYNEDGVEFARSIAGLARNIEYCQSFATSGSRREFTICIIADGRDTIHPTTLHWAIKLGLLSNRENSLKKTDNLASGNHLSIYKKILSTKKVARIAEEVAREHNLSLVELLRQKDIQSEKNYSYLSNSQESCNFTVIFCIKEENTGKLDSHWWFYNRLCPVIQPDYCIQMDVGTVPEDKTIQRLCQTLDYDKQCGAAAAAILTTPPKHLWKIVDSWQYATFVWDKTTDWAVQALCGYLDVLPGQFSIIRWTALSTDSPLEQHPKRRSPLKQYFRGLEKLPPLESNLFLAEDRVLGFEIIAQPQTDWTIKYVPDAIAITDECKSLSELLKQRRRWINSGNIAILYNAVRYCFNRHSQTKIKLIKVSAMIWNILETIIAWFLPFLIFTPLLLLGIQSNDIFAGNQLLVEIIPKIVVTFLLTWFIQLLLCFKNKLTQNWTNIIFYTTFLIQMSILFCLKLLLIVQNPLFGILTIGVMLICPLITIRKISPGLFKQFIPSMLTYVLGGHVLHLLLTTYAVVNLHDCSWGTKGLHLKRQTAINQRLKLKYELTFQPKNIIFTFIVCIGALMLGIEAFSGKILMSNLLTGLGFALIFGIVLNCIKPHFTFSRHDKFISFRNNILIAWLLTNGSLIFAMTQLENSHFLQVWSFIYPIILIKIVFAGVCGLIHYQREKRLFFSVET
ncbi:MAG: glycosyltransferase family 2 protein [Cyanobacteria bacterium P01_H01_bin.150]